MKLRAILSLLAMLVLPFMAFADIDTEREMGRLKKDKNVIWAEVRAESELAAKTEAMKQLQDKVTDYFTDMGENPNAVYISQLSTKTQVLTTHTSSNRFRVFVYLYKNNLHPLDDNGQTESLVLKRDGAGHLQQLDTTERADTVTLSDTTVVVRTINPVIALLSSAASFTEFRSTLKGLKEKQIVSHSAIFPLSEIEDYYVMVFDDRERKVALLHCRDLSWYNALTTEPVNIKDYKKYTGIWFTLNETAE